MNVYLLSAGDYSDWSIKGVFSTLEKLEAGKAKLIEAGDRLSSFNDPDQYEVDELISHEIGPVWHASIYCETGEMFNVSVRPSSSLLRHPTECVVQTWDTMRWTNRTDKWAIQVQSPISSEHAVKVATEKRQEWLRLRETVN